MPKLPTHLAVEPLEGRVVLTAGSWAQQALPSVEQELVSDVQDSQHKEWGHIETLSQSIHRTNHGSPQDMSVAEQQDAGGLIVPALQAARATARTSDGAAAVETITLNPEKIVWVYT